MQQTLTASRESIEAQSSLEAVASTWLPVAMGLTLIALESTSAMSGEKTSHALRPLFTYIFGPMSDLHWGEFHHVLRKSGHLLGYGTLGLVWLRAWLRAFVACAEWTTRQWRMVAAALAIGCTFLTGSADEIHQTFLPNRTGQFSDVLLDTSGALLFTVLLALRWQRQKQIRNTEELPC
jgi:VanZ family protein